MLDLSIRSQFPERTKVEDRLKRELEEARIAYESATERYKKAVKHCDERDGNSSPHPNITHPLKNQNDTFETYRLALVTFNKFVLYGEVPE